MGKTLLEATVKETKKCRHPSKFYVSVLHPPSAGYERRSLTLSLSLCLCVKVYVLEVTWSEGTSTIIYRRYSDFFEFQVNPSLSL